MSVAVFRFMDGYLGVINNPDSLPPIGNTENLNLDLEALNGKVKLVVWTTMKWRMVVSK